MSGGFLTQRLSWWVCVPLSDSQECTCGVGPTTSSVLFAHQRRFSVLVLLLMTFNGHLITVIKLLYQLAGKQEMGKRPHLRVFNTSLLSATRIACHARHWDTAEADKDARATSDSGDFSPGSPFKVARGCNFCSIDKM